MTLLAAPSELETYGEEALSEARARLLIEGSSGVVRAYCGWRIDEATETLAADADSYVVALPTLLLTAVAAVTVNGAAATGWDWTRSGLLIGVPLGRLEAEVTHGHAEVPFEVRQVVLAHAYRTHLNPAGHGSEQGGGITAGYGGGVLNSGGLLSEEKAILNRHKVPGAP